jgi:hypothetical protein
VPAPFARFGFECGDGWHGLIDRLSLKLAADPNLVVGQLKEKMGLLTIYLSIGESVRPGKAGPKGVNHAMSS